MLTIVKTSFGCGRFIESNSFPKDSLVYLAYTLDYKDFKGNRKSVDYPSCETEID